MNNPSLGKTASTWSDADVFKGLHRGMGYDKDQGNISNVVDAVAD